MAGVQLRVVGYVLDFDLKTIDSLGQVSRDEKFLLAPAAIACDNGMLCLAKLALRTRIAVNAGVATGSVPLPDILPFSVGFVQPNPNLGPLVRVEIVEFAAKHHTKIIRVQVHL